MNNGKDEISKKLCMQMFFFGIIDNVSKDVLLGLCDKCPFIKIMLVNSTERIEVGKFWLNTYPLQSTIKPLSIYFLVTELLLIPI